MADSDKMDIEEHIVPGSVPEINLEEESPPSKPEAGEAEAGEDWVDVVREDGGEADHVEDRGEAETETAGGKEEDVAPSVVPPAAAAVVVPPAAAAVVLPPAPAESSSETPAAGFIPSFGRLMKKQKKLEKKKQVEGGSSTKRKTPVKFGADKAYEQQFEVATAHHEFDDKPPEQILDLCLIMDCTGSMSSWIEHCKETLHKVIDATVERDPECKVRTAFVGYRDFSDGAALFDLHDFSYDANKVKKFISKCKAKGGGDFPEDVQGAIRKALDLSWSGLDDSVKLAVFVADAPAHGRKYHTGTHQHDDFPDGNPAGLVLEDLMKEMSDKEILISLYQLNNKNETMYKIMQEAHALGVEKSGVEYVDMRDVKPAPRVSSVGSSRSAHRSRVARARLERPDRDMYSARTSGTIAMQCSKMRSSTRMGGARSCKRGW